MKQFIVRRVTPTARDVELVAPLFDSYRQFYGQPADAQLAREFIQNRLQAGESVIFLAESAEESSTQALGFVQLYPLFSSVAARRIWVLNDLFVVPAARRAGVGRALMEAARKHALQAGANWLILETTADNRTAQLLYESLGYVCQNDSARFYMLELV